MNRDCVYMDTEARSRMRRLRQENEQLKLRLARCSCGRQDTRLEALGVPDIIRRYRTALSKSQARIDELEARGTRSTSQARIDEARGDRTTSQARIDELEAQTRDTTARLEVRVRELEAELREAQTKRRFDDTALALLERATECLREFRPPQEPRATTLRTEIGALDSEIAMLRAALRHSLKKRHDRRPS